MANLAVNEADLVIGVGYRFSVPQIGTIRPDLQESKKYASILIQASF